MQNERFNNLLVDPYLLDHETVHELKVLTDEFPWFQGAWILYLKNLKEIKDSNFEPVLKKASIRISDRKQLYRFLNQDRLLQEETSRPDYSKNINTEFHLKVDNENGTGNSLIERFLSSNPGILKRSTAGVEEQSNGVENEILKNSVTENDELVTETLALIYLQQKKYDKALESFRKLSLKFPEKSVYFATRIEEIDKLKNI